MAYLIDYLKPVSLDTRCLCTYTLHSRSWTSRRVADMNRYTSLARDAMLLTGYDAMESKRVVMLTSRAFDAIFVVANNHRMLIIHDIAWW